MELKLLEDFVCLGDVRNFSRAAEIRHVSQSTLSKRIRTLEHWLGVTLIDRSSYPVQLTTEGKVMIRQARDLVQQINSLRLGVRKLAKQPRDQVSILSMHTLRITFLPKWLESIEAQIGHFDRHPNPASSAYSETIRQFRNDESDLLLTYVHPAVPLGIDPKELDCIVLGSERLLPVSAPDEDGAPLYDLDRDDVVRFLSYGTQSFFAQALAPLLREKMVALNIVASNAMSLALQSLALVGTGLAWAPESLAREDLDAGRLVVAGHPDWIIRNEIAIYRKKRKHRPIVEKIWHAACTQARAPSVLPLPAAEEDMRIPQNIPGT